MRVTSMYRPPSYSPIVGGSATDIHTQAKAIDFVPIGISIQDAKQILIPKLHDLNCRLERGTTDWIHADSRLPGPSGRYFTP